MISSCWLRPSCIRRSTYRVLPATASSSISWFPSICCSTRKDMTEILSIFNDPVPIFRFDLERQKTLFQLINQLTELSHTVEDPAIRNMMI